MGWWVPHQVRLLNLPSGSSIVLGQSQRGLLWGQRAGRNRHVCVRMPSSKIRAKRDSHRYTMAGRRERATGASRGVICEACAWIAAFEATTRRLRYRAPLSRDAHTSKDSAVLPHRRFRRGPVVVRVLARSSVIVVARRGHSTFGSHEVLRLCSDAQFMLGAVAKPPPLHFDDDETFVTAAEAAADIDQLLVVKFSAEWCGPCRQIGHFFDSLP